MNSKVSQALHDLASYPLWPDHPLFSSTLITLLCFGFLQTPVKYCAAFFLNIYKLFRLVHLSLNVAFSVKSSIFLHTSLDIVIYIHNTLYITFISPITTETEQGLLYLSPQFLLTTHIVRGMSVTHFSFLGQYVTQYRHQINIF